MADREGQREDRQGAGVRGGRDRGRGRNRLVVRARADARIGRHPLRRRSGSDRAGQCGRRGRCSAKHRPAGRSAAAGPGPQWIASCRRREVVAWPLPRQSRDRAGGSRRLPGRDLANAPAHHVVHLRAVLRRQARLRRPDSSVSRSQARTGCQGRVCAGSPWSTTATRMRPRRRRRRWSRSCVV